MNTLNLSLNSFSMKILITGSDGQLGRSIQQKISIYPDLFFDFTDIDQLDITNKPSLHNYIETYKPGVIVNCAAYTAVDKAEDDAEAAFLLNAKAVEYLAQIALENNILLIHISTDFVFDGEAKSPYTEEDIAKPTSVYSNSKLEGENAILKIGPNAIIIRTSWLYSEYGHNFAKTILRLAKEKSEIKVVSDQIGTPTYAGDLAVAILNIIGSRYNPKGIEIFHYSNEGFASWYDFANEIVKNEHLLCSVLPIATEEYPLPAKRPKYSVMCKENSSNIFILKFQIGKRA